MMEEIKKNKIPHHVAIIMDGNGRWARTKGKLRVFGHQNGINAVKDTVEGAVEIGIKYLTLFAFSTENWQRPKKEINSLMELLVSSIKNEINTLMKNNISLKLIGDIKNLPAKCQDSLTNAINKTKNNTQMTLILALSYSSRWEIVNAIQNIVANNININNINEACVEQHLSTKNVPDPELVIRTSGEYRVSNFLLWQIAYSELYFTDIFWPDFRKNDLEKAILEYQKRERRFGKTK